MFHSLRGRHLWLALALGAFGLTGCPATPGPLSKHANAFAAATVIVVNGASDAYTKANTLHDDAEMSLAVLDYDKNPSWNPSDYVKPLLSPEQLEARLTILNGLKTYAQTVADLASGGSKTDLNKAAADVGTNLQELSKSVASSLSTSIPGAAPLSDTEKNAISTALVGLGTFLAERRVEKSLPKVIEDSDSEVSELCKILDSDITILRRQADVDYGRVIMAEDQFIRHAGTSLNASDRRAEIRKIPEFVLEQQQNDELLAKLQKTIQSLSLTHHAFAAAAQGNNPESVSQYISDLSAEGQSLAAYYQSLSSTSTK
jgi:hypothetical protein